MTLASILCIIIRTEIITSQQYHNCIIDVLQAISQTQNSGDFYESENK